MHKNVNRYFSINFSVKMFTYEKIRNLKMYRFRKFLHFVVFATAANSFLLGDASAGSQTGKIVALIVRASDGLVYVELDGVIEGRPGCAANRTYWMIRDEKSLTGKQQLAVLLQAYAMDKSVAIAGSGACTRWQDGEDIDMLILR